MEKLVYLIDADGALPGADLREGLVEKAAPALRKAGAGQIAVNVEDEHVAAGAAVKISRNDPRFARWFRSGSIAPMIAGPARMPCRPTARVWRVTWWPNHALWSTNPRWASARRVPTSLPASTGSPGSAKKSSSTGGTTNTARWPLRLNPPRPMSATQSCGVSRQGRPCADGIVEETFPIEALTDPHVWYNCDNEEEYQRRLARMMESVQAFLDFEPMVSIPCPSISWAECGRPGRIVFRANP